MKLPEEEHLEGIKKTTNENIFIKDKDKTIQEQSHYLGKLSVILQ